MSTSIARVLRTFALSVVSLVIAAGLGWARADGTTTFQLTAVSSGNWNSAGVHTLSNYQTGHSNQLPQNQAGYFEFNFDAVKGRTLVSNFILIPGSLDYRITTLFPQACGGAPCFKIGIAPQGPLETADIVSSNSNNNKLIYKIGNSDGVNQDLGYAWLSDGLHPGMKFNADHYGAARLQAEMDAGGNWVFWSRVRYDTGQSGVSGGACMGCPGGFENYIWGKSSYSTGIVLFLVVANGPPTTAVIRDGVYQIRNLNSGLALELPAGNTDPGTAAELGSLNAGANQQWTVNRLSNGNYSITSAATGLALQVPNRSNIAGETIEVAAPTGRDNQQWTLTGTTDDNYTVANVGSALPMGVAGAKTLAGTSVDQFNSTGFADQQWSFHKSHPD